MPTTDAIRRRLKTTRDLRAIVRTMKALAAVNIRQYEETMSPLTAYAQTVEYGLQALLQVRPEVLRRLPVPSHRRIGTVVLGSDHGLCGAFNEQVAGFSLERREADAVARGAGPLLAVGGRVAARLEDMGWRPTEVLALPASAVRIGTLVRDLLERVAAWRAAGSVEDVRLYFNVSQGPAGYQPREELLLPLDEARLRTLAATPWRPRAVPTLANDWETLFAAVAQQHLFVTLHRAIAQSLVSENASRLAALHAAERSIDERLVALQDALHRQRQDAITTELLDIVSGFETLMPGLP